MHDLMKQQKRAGFDVHALSTLSDTNLSSRDKKRFVKRYDLSKSEGALIDLKKAANYLWNFEAETAMEKALTDLKPDVVHLHNIYHHLSTSILKPIRKHKVCCVQTLHDLKLACPNYRMYTEGSICERCKNGRYSEAIKHHCISPKFFPNALAAAEMGFTKFRHAYERTVHAFICPSDFMAQKMIDWGEPASKFKVVRMPVTMRKPAFRGGGYLFAAGRLSTEKGYDLLIRAAAKVPEIKIKIAGRGPLQDELQDLIKELGVGNVELVGFKRGLDLANLYRKAEAYVACPIGYENSPLTVLDAIGYGLPIIATRIGGLPEMLEDEKSGFLVDRGNLDAWVRTLKRFAALTKEERDNMASASHKFAEKKYPDAAGHAEFIEEIYKSL